MEKSLCLQSGRSGFKSCSLPDPASSPPAVNRTPFWLWPHVLSLEAPLVAVLWLAALAHLNDFTLMPGVAMGLGLAVWLIYVADRLLDAWGLPVQALDVRHRFYRRFRWPLVLAAMPAAGAWLVWLGLWVVPSGLLLQALAQLLPIALYLVLYSGASPRVRRWLLQGGVFLVLLLVNMLPLSTGLRLTVSFLIAGGLLLFIVLKWDEKIGSFIRKEAAAGLLFAYGCTTWTRFHAMGSGGWDVWGELVLLTLLFVSNLALIHARETREETVMARAKGTLYSALLLSTGALVSIPLGHLPLPLLPLTFAVCGGLTALEALRAFGFRRLSPEAFRVWADLIVALPPVVLLLWA